MVLILNLVVLMVMAQSWSYEAPFCLAFIFCPFVLFPFGTVVHHKMNCNFLNNTSFVAFTVITCNTNI